MIGRAAVAALNHLLSAQSWARERLRPFAGKRLQFRLAPLPDLHLLIADSGLLEAATADAAADLVVTVKPGAVPRLLSRDEAALEDVELAGPADLASTVQLLFRELQWDLEEDLSKLVGDIAAHRITGVARDLLAWQKEAASRLAQNFAEYLTEEQPLLARHEEAAAHRRDLEALREDCARLESRVEWLESMPKRARS